MLTSIDKSYFGMMLVYKLKSVRSKTTWVSFDPPLSGYEGDINHQLLGMKADA
jgi:hypothetical protein